MRKARSRDCKHSYLNWATGKVHCHKKRGLECITETCKCYRKEESYDIDDNSRRLDRMEVN